jgi:hypothetical protein
VTPTYRTKRVEVQVADVGGPPNSRQLLKRGVTQLFARKLDGKSGNLRD